MLALLVGVGVAFAASLTNSKFEIDTDANMVVNTAGNLDWANVAFDRKQDEPTGQNDNSFVQGTKEDTPVPVIEKGSIPNNKSDLRDFGVYLESNANGRFLNLFWSRVQDPSGTTNMDFELNKRQCIPNTSDVDCSANGLTPIRSAGDVLIQYDLSKGGNTPQLFVSRWVTSGPSQCEASNSFPCWSTKTELTAANVNDAIGSINATTVPALNTTPPLGPFSPRTFGEASIDFDALASGGTDPCSSFGSAYLKSRSSDSFTSALKDFIAPLNKSIGNCGNIVIKKETNPDGSTQPFDFTLKRNNENVIGPFSLTDGQTKDSLGVLPGSGYVAAETVPEGWDLTSATCQDPTNNSTPGNINVAPNETVTCTFTNTQQRGRIVVDKVTDPPNDPQSFHFTLSGGPDSINQGFDLTHADNPHDSGAVKPGTYSAVEDDQAGWDLTDTTCDNGSDVDAIDLAAGETVTCTFSNTKQTSTLTTEQSFIPQDKATVGGVPNSGFDGTVDFRLYSGSTCGGATPPAPLYEELDVALTGTTARTNNDGDPDSVDQDAGYTITGTGGTFSWKVTYEGDTNEDGAQHPDAETCKEESTVTINNDNTPNTP
jgi:hypothetical protein